MANDVLPFLRWPGGKRVLAEEISKFLPASFGRYYEPFAGSAALLFKIQPRSAVLGDLSTELIATYEAVQLDVEAVINWLRKQKQDKSSYYRIRQMRPTSLAGRAGRFIYLNRLAFNGIWRVNREGTFNVPYGYRPRADLVGEEALRNAASILRRVELRRGDFRETLIGIRRGAFVYADPPYTLAHENNGFRKYNERLFSWDDQVRLANYLSGLASRGVHVCVSNARHPQIRKLYPGFREVHLQRHVSIAGSVASRGMASESLFISD